MSEQSRPGAPRRRRTVPVLRDPFGSPRAGGSTSVWTGRQPVGEAFGGLVATVRLLRRRRLFLIAWIAIWVVGGLVYVKLLRSEFIATTQVLLRPRQIINDGPEDLRHFHQFMVDSQQCETELRILRSEQLLYRVFKSLDLANAPEIRSGPDGLWSWAGGLFHALEGRETPAMADVQAFYAFSGRVRSRRLGLSHVIEISYRAQSGEQAARGANAIAVAYMASRLRGVFARAQSRGVYRDSRLKGLQAQIMAADAGIRFGLIPDYAMPDADVRLLGPANVPPNRVYPKPAPFIVFLAGLATISGALIVVLSTTLRSPGTVVRRRGVRDMRTCGATTAPTLLGTGG